MTLLQSDVLVVDQEFEDLQTLKTLLGCLQCSVITVNTQDQAVVHASQAQPYLVILMGNRLNRAQSFIDQLRKTVNNRCITIVALTDVHAPSWLHQEENPGFDGFLVKPISGDVLSSLVQSAWARQAFSSAC